MMSVLSDSEIRKRISLGELVLNGDASRAEECSYAFRPGRAFLAGVDHTEFEFNQAANCIDLVVDPGKMVWIRTFESISLPNDLVGFWWQTNTLSRKGLMLVNMSMVEPGYCGNLACLFVNFGNQKIIVNRNTSIAKMVFMEIKGVVQHPYDKGKSPDEYDSILKELAVNQPTSFLKVGDLAKDLELEKQKIINLFEEEKRSSHINLQNEKDALIATIRSEIAISLKSSLDDFKSDAPKAIWKTYALAVGALVLLGLATALGGWIKENIFEDTKELVRAETKRALNDRVIIGGTTPQNQETALIINKINDLNKRVVTIETKKK